MCKKGRFFLECLYSQMIAKRAGRKWLGGVSSPIAQTHQALVGAEEGLFLSLSVLPSEMPLHDLNREK
jgi:hypothetical protein